MGQASDVLVVDDDVHIREFVQLVLSGEGYEVVGVPHGVAALTLLEQREQGRQRLPAVILLDMQMPVMNGWEFASAYHQRPGPHVPLVVMTAALDATSRAALIGAADVLGKPFGLRALLDWAPSEAPLGDYTAGELHRWGLRLHQGQGEREMDGAPAGDRAQTSV